MEVLLEMQTGPILLRREDVTAALRSVVEDALRLGMGRMKIVVDENAAPDEARVGDVKIVNLGRD